MRREAKKWHIRLYRENLEIVSATLIDSERSGKGCYVLETRLNVRHIDCLEVDFTWERVNPLVDGGVGHNLQEWVVPIRCYKGDLIFGLSRGSVCLHPEREAESSARLERLHFRRKPPAIVQHIHDFKRVHVVI